MNAAHATRVTEIAASWPALEPEERRSVFAALDDADATDVFLALDAHDQAQFLASTQPSARRLWARLLPPDDAADVVQALPPEDRSILLDALDVHARSEVEALLAYAEDAAGGLMDPRYVVLRPDQTADQALAYVRRQERQRDGAFYYAYVLDAEHRVVGVLTLRELLRGPGDVLVRDLMHTDILTVRDDTDQEEVARRMGHYDLLAIPVVDAEGRMQGVVTIDDVIDVLEEEASEDIHKLGGSEALDGP